MNNIRRKKINTSKIKTRKWEIIWGVYVVVLALYLYYCYNSSDTLWVQVGIFLLTIVAMIIIMLHSSSYQRKLNANQIQAVRESTDKQLIELQKLTHTQIEASSNSTEKQIDAIRESTDRQIEVFIEQFQGITAQLEDIASIWTMKAEEEEKERKKRLEMEAERIKVELERLEMLKQTERKTSEEKQNKIERLKPRVFARVEQRSYAIFWEHLWLNFANMGGDGKDLKIDSLIFKSGTKSGSIQNQRYEYIKREETRAFDCGNINNFRAFDMVKVKILIRDIEERKYVGELTFNKVDAEWHEVALTEVSG